MERIVDLHENVQTGSTGRGANGIGAICLTLLCRTGAAIRWAGVTRWRRGLTVQWRASFARINWDLHSAAGFWCFPIVLMWAVSGIYLVFQDQFVDSVFLGPAGRVASWLTPLHFGRLNWFTEAMWALLGLIPGNPRVHWRVCLLSPGLFQEAIESQPNGNVDRVDRVGDASLRRGRHQLRLVEAARRSAGRRGTRTVSRDEANPVALKAESITS